MTPKDVIERVLTSDFALLTDHIEQDTPSLDKPAATAAAPAAVQRRSTLFADVSMPDLEAIPNDPMLALKNRPLRDSEL